MIRLMLFLHVAGFVLWLGGGLSMMFAGIRGRREERVVQGAVARIQAAINRILIVPGVILTTISGFYLSGPAMRSGSPSVWLMVMQGAGVVGALLALFVVFPAVSRLARIPALGETAPAFDAVRRRVAVAGSIAGTLGIVALIAGMMGR